MTQGNYINFPQHGLMVLIACRHNIAYVDICEQMRVFPYERSKKFHA